MTDQEINVAIAEECGKQVCKHPPSKWDRRGTDGDSELYCADCRNYLHNMRVPSYATDLNAMHEAELIFRRSAHERLEYGQLLTSMCADDNSGGRAYGREVWNATARQRAEAFLRVKGKWKD